MYRMGVLGLLLLVGCQSPKQDYEMGEIYSGLAQLKGPDRNPVIVIPGILGSRLKDSQSEQLLWGAFTPGTAKPRRPEDARLMAIPMERGKSLAQLRDEVVPDGALAELKVAIVPGLRVEADAYQGILQALGAGGYRDETFGQSGTVDYGDDHYTCFQFDYDWRRSCAESAARLSEFIEEKRAYVESENRRRFGSSGRVKFDLVAHSQGALIARYFLRYGNQPFAEKRVAPD